MFFGLLMSLALGQSSDPDRDRTKVPTKSKKSSPKAKQTTPAKPKQPPSASQRRFSIPKQGTLSITVNEPDSEIVLTAKDGKTLQNDSLFTGSQGSPIVLDELEPGNYTIVIRKPGYSEAIRQVTVVGGKVNPLSVSLTSIMAFLNISVDPNDAEIEIEGVGRYLGALRRHQLRPGSYAIKVSKTGYLSRSMNVDLLQSGIERSFSFTLKEIPITVLVSEAELKLRSLDYDGAIQTLNPVLSAIPNHAAANRITGTALFAKGDQNSIGHLVNAIRGGERVVLPFRLVNNSGGMQLRAAELVLSGNDLVIQVQSQPELGIRFFKPNLQATNLKVDKNGLSFVTIEGTGEANMKKVKRTLQLYSRNVVLTSNRKATLCPQHLPNSPSQCQNEADLIKQLIETWRIGMR